METKCKKANGKEELNTAMVCRWHMTANELL
jgi:hypothetical protein